MGFSGPVDINHLAVHEAMRLYEIEDKRSCFEKVLAVAASEIKTIHEKSE